MPWKPQGGGGPWGGGGNSGGPWGGGSGGGGPTGGGGQQPPDLEDMLRRSQDSLKNLLPGGFGSGRALILAAVAALVLWLGSGIYRVDAGHQGVVMLFGQHMPEKDSGPGLHWYFPAPIGKVLTPNVEAVRRIDVGFRGATGSKFLLISKSPCHISGFHLLLFNEYLPDLLVRPLLLRNSLCQILGG